MIDAVRPDQPVHLSSEEARNPKLWALSQSLEATFLAEMLKSADFGEARDSFGGGVGEEQFSGLLVQHQADELVKTNGLGLAESIYRSLVREGGSS